MYWAWDGPADARPHGRRHQAFLGAVGMDGTTVSTVAGERASWRRAASSDGRYEAYVVAKDAGTGSVVVAASDGLEATRSGARPAALGSRRRAAAAFIGLGEGDRIAPLPIGPCASWTPGPATCGRSVKDVVSFFWSPTGGRSATLGVPSARNPDAASAGGDSAMSPAARRRAPGVDRRGTRGPGRSPTPPGVPVSLAFVDVARGRRRRPCRVADPLFVNRCCPTSTSTLSHRLWSPDGTSILLPVVGADGVESLDLLPADGSAPRVVPGRSGSGAPEPLAARSERPDEHDADDHRTSGHEVAHVGHRDARCADREQDHAEHSCQPQPAPLTPRRAR